jgi:hypothetical protein
MSAAKDAREPEEIGTQAPPGEATSPAAWEEIEPGRYMPRRIIGSFRGGQLG